MRRLRQARLGGTVAKCLTIVDLVPLTQQHRAPNPVGKSYILQLPDKLLVAIVELSARNFCSSIPGEYQVCSECLNGSIWNDCTRPWNYGSLKTLSRVCHRLAKIAQPLLFHTIHFKWRNETVPPSRLVRKLHNTLKGNPRLRQHCRSFSICIAESESQASPPHRYLVASDFARWFTRTRCLRVHGGFGHYRDRTRNRSTWTLIRRFATHCRDLEHLELGRADGGLYLDSNFEWLDFPNLKTLSLYGLSELSREKVELEPRALRTAPFTSLDLSRYRERPEALSLIIQWPAVLSRFHFDLGDDSLCDMDYSGILSLLLIHKDTLKHIDIGFLSVHGSRCIFNATLFPNLEFLKLSRWQTHGYPVQFRASDADVLGPKLRTFCWNFCHNYGETWTAFEEAEIFWIRDLANAAVACKAVLDTIIIQFWPSYGNTEEGMIYPWDLMDDLRDHVLRPKGMDLVYNDPPISKEEWMEYLQSLKVGGPAAAFEAYRAKFYESSLVSEEEQLTESSDGEGFVGEYQGEDIRKYFTSGSSI